MLSVSSFGQESGFSDVNFIKNLLIKIKCNRISYPVAFLFTIHLFDLSEYMHRALQDFLAVF